MSCYYYRKLGHKKSKCIFSKRDKKVGIVRASQIYPKKKNKGGTTTVTTSNNENVFLISNENYLNLTFDDCIWIIDSGTSFHVTPHEGFFSSNRNGDFGTMKMGNHVTSKIVGIGEVTLMTGDGRKLVLKEVRHVPEMHLNLISTGKLAEVGMINQFGVGKWKLSRGSIVVTRGKKEGSLYIMHGTICKGETNVAQDAAKELWHKRLGHMSEKGWEFLAKDHFPTIK